MNVKHLLCYLLFLIFIFGCASSQMTKVVYPDGQPAPNPYYLVETTDSTHPLRVSFYHVLTTEVEDLDGSKQSHPTFLSRKDDHYFLLKDDVHLNTVLRIINPWNKKYRVFYILDIKCSDGGVMQTRSQLAYSDKNYREIYCPMPLLDEISKATHEVHVTNENGKILIRTGKFNYFVN